MRKRERFGIRIEYDDVPIIKERRQSLKGIKKIMGDIEKKFK